MNETPTVFFSFLYIMMQICHMHHISSHYNSHMWYLVMWYSIYDAATGIQWWKIHHPEPCRLDFRCSLTLPFQNISQSRPVTGSFLKSERVHSLVQDCDLVLDAVLFALQRLLGDALYGHQLLGPLLLGEDHLGERAPETQTHTGHKVSPFIPSITGCECFIICVWDTVKSKKKPPALMLNWRNVSDNLAVTCS